MDNTHSAKPKRTLKEQFVEGMIFLGIILAVITFAICAAIYDFDVDKMGQLLFGFITIGAIVVAIVAFVAAIVIRLFKLLFGK